MQYRIFPSIGIARLGNSSEYFVGPEVIGSRGRGPDGAEVAIFKDAQFKVRKQAARFHVFQRADTGSPWVPLSSGRIEWGVKLANKKDAIVRPTSPIDPSFLTPTLKIRPTPDPSRADRLIQAQGTIPSDAGSNVSVELQGQHKTVAVKLAELRVDSKGRLLLLAGDVDSASVPAGAPIGDSYYSNPDWHDDVADGTITAKVTLPDNSVAQADPAWVITAPPDYAPGADPIVTLFDEILQVAIDNKLGGPWTTLPALPSFARDIQPIIRRARSLGWVHIDGSVETVTNLKNWVNISEDYNQLNQKGSATQALRTSVSKLINNVETRHLLSDFKVTSRQRSFLNQWVTGQFTDDWTGVPAIAIDPTSESLTRAALEGAVGQGFLPGIEGGRILADPSIYIQPFDFRIDPAALQPGDVTALMAQPWQADFLKCSGNWWPSQRPDLAPQADGSFLLWHRPLSSQKNDHARLVDMVTGFGMITVQVDSAGKQVSAREEGRDPALPST